MINNLTRRLCALGIDFVADAEGKTVSSYRGGGKLALAVYPKDAQEVSAALREIKDAGVPYTVMGAGTNCLIRDSGYAGAAICTSKLKGITHTGHTVIARAGERLAAVAAYAAKNDLGGLEELSGIPSSVGGAVYMNAGAFGRETCELLCEAEVLDTNSLAVLSKKTVCIPYSYRSSGDAFQNCIICAASFGLQEGYNRAIELRCREARLNKQPREPSLGSVFKNPEVFPAGYLIEAVGLKGFRLGNAAISGKHANFIVNLGGGTAKDYLSLMELAQSMVYNEYKIELQPEIHILG